MMLRKLKFYRKCIFLLVACIQYVLLLQNVKEVLLFGLYLDFGRMIFMVKFNVVS